MISSCVESTAITIESIVLLFGKFPQNNMDNISNSYLPMSLLLAEIPPELQIGQPLASESF